MLCNMENIIEYDFLFFKYCTLCISIRYLELLTWFLFQNYIYVFLFLIHCIICIYQISLTLKSSNIKILDETTRCVSFHILYSVVYFQTEQSSQISGDSISTGAYVGIVLGAVVVILLSLVTVRYNYKKYVSSD